MTYISPFGSQVSCLSGRICDSSCMSVVFAWGDCHADLPGSSGRGTENFGSSCFCQPSPRLSIPNTFLIGTQRLILSDLPDLAGDQYSSLNLSPPVGFCDSTLSSLPLDYNFSVLTLWNDSILQGPVSGFLGFSGTHHPLTSMWTLSLEHPCLWLP